MLVGLVEELLQPSPNLVEMVVNNEYKNKTKQKTTGSSICCSESEARKFLFWPYCWDPNRCVLQANRKQMLRKTPRVIRYRISGVIEGNFSIRMASLMCILLQA